MAGNLLSASCIISETINEDHDVQAAWAVGSEVGEWSDTKTVSP